MANEDPSAIDALLITHEHQDHVQGVAVLARKLGVPVYFTQATHRAWMRWMMPHKRITYAAWLAQQQQDLARKQTVVPADEDVLCAEDAAEDALEPRPEDPKLEETKTDDPCRLPGVEYFAAGSGFLIGDIAITPFTIPHDAADPVGFVFEADGVGMAIATDLGICRPM